MEPGHCQQVVPHRSVWHAQAEGAGMMSVPQRPWPRYARPCHTPPRDGQDRAPLLGNRKDRRHG